MPNFFLKASAMAFDGPVYAELYKLTVPSFFAPSTTAGSLAARAAPTGSSALAPNAAPSLRTLLRDARSWDWDWFIMMASPEWH
jgi:hypothetical protein